MSKFQVILLCLFGFFIFLAVAVFALYRGGAGAGQASIVVWGDLSSQDFFTLTNSSSFNQDNTLTISYVEKRRDALEADFTEALAAGSGPDLVMLSQDSFYKNKNKLTPIPYQSISEQNFKETFVEAGEVFLTPEGIYGLPFSIDPLVLYYNRDLLSSAGIAKPLSYWDEIYNASQSLTQRDAAGNITQSVIALGETRNIANWKEIVSLLLLQAGTPITGFSGAELRSFLSYNFDLPVAPAESAVDFYTQFSNPTKAYYSWNRTLSEAQTRFASGDSAYYIGFASELRALRNKNPTLNLGVAPVPQSRVSGKVSTTGRLRALAISRGARNPSAALEAAIRLVSKESSANISQILALPPVRRDLLSDRPTDSIFPIFYAGALQSKSWIDPDNVATAQVFKDMIERVTSGRARTSESVKQANDALQNLLD